MLESVIQSIYRVSGTAAQALTDLVTIQDIARNELFSKIGLRNDREYFLLEGYCRSVIPSHEGIDITTAFYLPGTAISPNISRTRNGISFVNLQALTDIRLGAFSTHDLSALMIANREIMAWGNHVLQLELFNKVEKERCQLSMDARARLLLFRVQYPMLENIVPHPYIASFLGITNVSLSRLRSELSRK